MASSASSSSPPLMRLSGIPLSKLPSPTAGPETLTPFVHALLREAIPFVESASPKGPAGATASGSPDPKFWKHKGNKTSPDSAAQVEAWERIVHVSGGAGTDKETWALRKSLHEDRAEKGTASWGEFVRCFRDEHAEAEDGFTPNVIATHEALVWDCARVPTLTTEIEGGSGSETWGDFRLKVEEMRHKIGKPLKDRTFPVLQLTASSLPAPSAANGGAGAAVEEGTDEFVVVSVPIPDFGSSESSRLAREKGAQVASYVSVERIRRLLAGEQQQQKKIEWLMATASDAGGVLPMFVQNLAMPGVVWKDVPLFLSWIARERQSRDIVRDGVVGKGQHGRKQEGEPAAAAVAPPPQVTTGTTVGTGPEISSGAIDPAGAEIAPEVKTGPSITEGP